MRITKLQKIWFDAVSEPATDIIIPELAWTRGFTEPREICSHADTYYLPITLHDTIGRIVSRAAAQMMLHIPSTMIQEVVGGYADGWYNDVLTEPVILDNDKLRPNGKPGLGANLRPELFSRPGAHIDVTSEDRVSA